MHLVLLCKATLTGDIHCQHYFALVLVHLGVSAINILYRQSHINEETYCMQLHWRNLADLP